jgi:hypothetical protein
VRELEHLAGRLLPVVHLLDSGSRARREEGGDLRHVLAALRNDAQTVRKRIRREQRVLLGVLLPLLRESLLLRDEDHTVLPDERARGSRARDVVHLRSGRLAVLGTSVVRAVVDLDHQLTLDVIAPGDDPAAERNDEAKNEHADQHRHGRSERG